MRLGLFVVIEKILDKNTVKIINVLATIGTVFIVIFFKFTCDCKYVIILREKSG